LISSGTICSILALYFRVSEGNSTDISWNLVPSLITGTVEVNIAIICGYLPTMPALYRKMSSGKGPTSPLYVNCSRVSDRVPMVAEDAVEPATVATMETIIVRY
jgi:hypothetical protein